MIKWNYSKLSVAQSGYENKIDEFMEEKPVKIIIAGDGKVGNMLTNQLSAEGHDITLVDSNPEVLEASIESYDVMTVQGNCASMEVLNQAGVQETDLLIAATSADEVNLLCCMTAHGMLPGIHTIARIRNPEYSNQIYKMRDTFALSLAVNPEKQAAVEIERLLKFPGFLHREAFVGGRVEIAEIRLEASNKLCNVSLNELDSIVKCRVLVCAVLRNGNVVTPDGNFVLKAGDRVFVTAPTNNLAILLNNIGTITKKVKNVMICGGSKIGFYLAQRLQKSGMSVKIIEQKKERCIQLASLLPHVTVIQGDASSQALLYSEDIEEMDALVTLTGLDEMNMIIAMYGKKSGVSQIITKVGRRRNGNLLDELELGSVVCPKELCCNNIVRYVRAMQNQTGAAVTVHTIADGQAEAMEFRVNEKTIHCNEPLKALKIRKNVLVASIIHGGQIEIPNGDSCFTQGDSVVVVTSSDKVLYQLNDIFE